jgi:hypothetical protein
MNILLMINMGLPRVGDGNETVYLARNGCGGK